MKLSSIISNVEMELKLFFLSIRICLSVLHYFLFFVVCMLIIQ